MSKWIARYLIWLIKKDVEALNRQIDDLWGIDSDTVDLKKKGVAPESVTPKVVMSHHVTGSDNDNTYLR